MPAGLHLDIIDTFRDGAGQARTAKRTRFGTLKGNAHRFGQPVPGEESGGYVFTDVDAEKFAQWLAQNEGSDILADHLVIHGSTAARVLSEAREKAKVPAMAARLVPNDGDPRIREVEMAGLKAFDKKD